MFEFLKKFVPSKNDREISKMQPMVARINDLEASIKALSDVQLQGKTVRWYAKPDGDV